jgi:hypothetical protein
MDKLYLRSQATDEYKVNQVVRNMDAEVVFMGSSKCHHSFVPSIIADSLNRTVYNAGLWGIKNIYFQYGLLNLFLERYTPKVICLEVHPCDVMQTPFSDLERIGSLAPFIGENAACDSLFKLAGTYYSYQVSHLYRYNSGLVNYILGSCFVENSQTDNGYKPLFKQASEDEKMDEFNFPMDERKISYLNKFIWKCKEKKIQLIFVSSPMYLTSTSYSTCMEFFQKVADENQLIFLNQTKESPLAGEQEFYADRGHFNDKGARLYSAIFGHLLKNILAQ